MSFLDRVWAIDSCNSHTACSALAGGASTSANGVACQTEVQWRLDPWTCGVALPECIMLGNSKAPLHPTSASGQPSTPESMPATSNQNKIFTQCPTESHLWVDSNVCLFFGFRVKRPKIEPNHGNGSQFLPVFPQSPRSQIFRVKSNWSAEWACPSWSLVCVLTDIKYTYMLLLVSTVNCDVWTWSTPTHEHTQSLT